MRDKNNTYDESIMTSAENYVHFILKSNHIVPTTRTTNTGDNTMLGIDYISAYNHGRKWRHMREMLLHAWDIANTPNYARFEDQIDIKFSRDNNAIAEYLRNNFTTDQINQAHVKSKTTYSGRGRPRHSRNIKTVERYSTHSENNDSALDNIIESTATDVTTASDTGNDSASSNANMADYVLKTVHSRDIDLVSERISFLTRNNKEISEHVHTLADKVKHLEESRINTITITPIDTTLPPIELGAQHKNFETLLAMCMARTPDNSHLNIWLYGPAGTGKTTAAKNVARALQRKFYSMGALETGYQILGYTGADGRTYKRTHFRECWEHGGVIALDECDSYTPSAALALNGALANGFCAFDDKLIERHPDCIIIAGANTTGLGGTMEYVGRMKHDAAFLDRFVMLDWPIDEALEAYLCDNHDWLKRVRHVRANILNKQIKGAMVTPRATIYGAALLRAGLALDVVERTVLKKGMTDAQWQQVA